MSEKKPRLEISFAILYGEDMIGTFARIPETGDRVAYLNRISRGVFLNCPLLVCPGEAPLVVLPPGAVVSCLN